MKKLILIFIALFSLSISSCKDEEKGHYLFLKSLSEADNPEGFLKSSSYYDSTCTDFRIDIHAIDWFSKLVKQDGFNGLIYRSYGIHPWTKDHNKLHHLILIRSKDSDTGRYPVGATFIKNEDGIWKLCRFNFSYN
jgi:hypothetical protein